MHPKFGYVDWIGQKIRRQGRKESSSQGIRSDASWSGTKQSGRYDRINVCKQRRNDPDGSRAGSLRCWRFRVNGLHLSLSLRVCSVYCFGLVQSNFFITQFGSLPWQHNHRSVSVAFGRHLTFYAVGASFNLFLVAGESAWRPEGSSLISSTLWGRLSEMIGQAMAAFSGGRAPSVSMVIILITELMNRSDQPLVTQIHLSP